MKSLFVANIYHKRISPRVNEFNYSGFYTRFYLDEIKNLNSLFFSVNKFNLFSFYEKDHGYRNGTDLLVWAKDILTKSGIVDFEGRIEIQTFPRVLGYVFNPVSFWYCYKQEKIHAVICEVNNTFGESHCYVLNKDVALKTQVLNKEFHVSPFYDVKGNYRFDFKELNSVKINYYLEDKIQLLTRISGREILFSDWNLLKLFLKYPFYTRFIVFLIHYQALKLFIKKIKFYPKPPKKLKEVTYE